MRRRPRALLTGRIVMRDPPRGGVTPSLSPVSGDANGPGHRTLRPMRRIAVMLLLTLITGSAGGSSLPEVDRFVARRMEDHLVPGLALVVIRDGAILHSRGFGDLTPAQPIIIGSLSKAFTATTVLQLVDEKKIELDAPMQRYLSDVRFSDPRAQEITVRHLLNQTSGIPGDAPRAGHAATLAQHVAELRDVRLVAPPGQQHIYSSPNYQILGRIIERVSGQPFGVFVQRRLLQPLRFSSSGVDAQAAGRVAPGHNIWWGLAGPATDRWEEGRLPTASLLASADDLAKFVLSHLGVGEQVLTAESLALSHLGAGKSESFSYAMGWRNGTTAGVPSLWHGGALPSYRSAIVMLPQSRSAVIVLTNSSSIFADHTREIAAGVVAMMERRPMPPRPRPLRHLYLGIALVSLGAVALQVRSLLRAARRSGRMPGKRSVWLFDLALPAVAVLLAPRLARVSYRGMWEGAPDVVLTAAVLIALGMTTGVLKLRRIAAD